MPNADSIIATRAFKMLYKDYDVANAIPAKTVGYDTAVTGFTDFGYTSGGLTLGVDQTRNPIRVDQEPYPVSNPITEVAVTAGAELAEVTPANIKVATGLGTLETVAAASGVIGEDTLTLDSTFTDQYVSVLTRVKLQNDLPMDVFFPRALSTGSMSTTITPDSPATIGLEVESLVDTNQDPPYIAIYRALTPATA